jgi:hypothetical protein
MLLLGLILCYLLGLSVMLTFSRKYSIFEVAGFGYLIGIGFETVFLFLLDVLSVKYSAGLLIGINLVSIIAICGANYKNLLALKDEFKLPSFKIENINFVALFLFAVIAYVFYFITVKNLFWPPSDHDAIGSFDKMARIMAIEGKLKISLYDYELEGAGGLYPPLYHGSMAYMYIFGAEIPKIVTTLFYMALMCSFYSLVTIYTGATAAAFFTLVLGMVPEVYSHAALTLGNLPTMAYTCAGALATIVWVEKRDTKYFWLAAILMAFVIWIRSDTVVFTAAALLIVGIDFLMTKDWKKTLIFGSIIVAPFIIWSLYVKFKIGGSQSKFDTGVGFNAERLSMMWGYLKAYLFGSQYGRNDGGQLFGLTFFFFYIMLIANLVLGKFVGWKEVLKDKWPALLMFVVSLGLYFAVFYIIDEKKQNSPLWSLMDSSFKRGIFFFIPIALFYAATNLAAFKFWGWVEKLRTAK